MGRSHTTGGPPDKIFEEACFLERFRNMLVMEEGRTLWLARATPRAWLEQGKTITVSDAPTHLGVTSFAIESDVDHDQIRATIHLPECEPGDVVLLRVRHPRSLPMARVEVDGQRWTEFDPVKEVVRFAGGTGTVHVVCWYGREGGSP